MELSRSKFAYFFIYLAFLEMPLRWLEKLPVNESNVTLHFDLSRKAFSRSMVGSINPNQMKSELTSELSFLELR